MGCYDLEGEGNHRRAAVQEIARLEPPTTDGFNGYKHWCEWELLAKQLFLYLVSFTASEGSEPAFVFGAPADNEEVWEAPMVKNFKDIVKGSGVSQVEFDQGALAHPQKAPTRLLQNLKLEHFGG